MPRPIEHRITSTFPAAQVFAALIDEAFLRARLAKLGGKRSELTSFTSDNGTTRYTMRQVVDAAHVPSMARALVGGDLVIERVEAWTVTNGGLAGTVEASVPNTPASVRGVRTLLDGVDGGSELVLTATVKVSVPLVGGKLEGMIAGQLTDLLEAEGRFTQSWLEAHAGQP